MNLWQKSLNQTIKLPEYNFQLLELWPAASRKTMFVLTSLSLTVCWANVLCRQAQP